MRKSAAVLVVLIASAGCSSAIALTDEGQAVRRVTPAEKPGGCRLLGDVSVGVPPDAARPRTQDELILLLRNKAGESDATHMIVDSAEERNADTERPYWVGRGRAYKCPEEPAAPPSSGGEQPETGGVEEMGEDEAPAEPGEGEDEGPAGDSAAEEDPLVQDLLGD